MELIIGALERSLSISSIDCHAGSKAIRVSPTPGKCQTPKLYLSECLCGRVRACMLCEYAISFPLEDYDMITVHLLLTYSRIQEN